MRLILLLVLIFPLLISGCEKRELSWLVFAQGTEAEGALRAVVMGQGEQVQHFRLPPSGYLRKGEVVSAELRLRPGDELRLEVEGPGEPAVMAAVRQAGEGEPAGWRLLYGPCVPGWYPARFRCVVDSREWEEFVALCSVPRKSLAADCFRVQGLAPGNQKEHVLGVLGPPVERFAEREGHFDGVELWSYLDLHVYLKANTGEVVSLMPKGSHGGVNLGAPYALLVEKWGWPDRVEPLPNSELWFVAIYDRPEGRVWWVVGESRVESVWIGAFLAD